MRPKFHGTLYCLGIVHLSMSRLSGFADDREFSLLRSELNGKTPSNYENLSFLDDASHDSAHFAFRSFMKDCLSAEALLGSELLSNSDRLSLALERPAAACLAILFTSLFSLILL